MLSTMTTTGEASGQRSRILSLDQFRGYTVAGMILVNFLGGFQCVPAVFKHHNTYFSYADSIMPSFHFAVGFALRLVLLKRIAAVGASRAYGSVVRRCFGLILLSTILELASGTPRSGSWPDLQNKSVWDCLAGPLKCEFWETLAIIGATSLFVLPVITKRVRTRLVFLMACALVHVYLSRAFYFDFIWARPNALDSWWGATDVKGLDGGPFGVLAWAIPQIVGSLAYDAVMARRGRAVPLLAASAALLMIAGYGLSCLTRLYDVAPAKPVSAGQDWGSFLAEPPFVQPPPLEQRALNYWMMSKRTASISFILFATGFALAAYIVFVLLGDVGRVEIGLFRTLGQNALAAYIIHEVIDKAVKAYAPKDSPLWWVAVTFAIFATLTYLAVRYLERNGVYLRM
jgi:predicted acyltransferase